MPPLLYRGLALSVHGSQIVPELLKSGSKQCQAVQNADVVELVDTLVLEASASAWEFESPHPHQSGLFQPGGAAPSSCSSASLQASFLFFLLPLLYLRHA